MIAVYPGTFDPVTYGHIDVIQRAARLFDKVIIAVVKHPQKKTLFTPQERFSLVHKVTQSFGSKVRVELFDGLLAQFVKTKKAQVIVRGLRAVSDFEYEFQMAITNKQLNAQAETVFLMTDKQYFYISSSLLKEIARHHGALNPFVPKIVQKALIRKQEGKYGKETKSKE